jgi:hypothetical protein
MTPVHLVCPWRAMAALLLLAAAWNVPAAPPEDRRGARTDDHAEKRADTRAEQHTEQHTEGLTADRTELERTAIVGNRELPKVLYIVPWKKPGSAPLRGRPPGGVLDEAPHAIDREVLRRQLRLQAQLQARTRTDNADTALPNSRTTPPTPLTPIDPRGASR